MAGLGYDVMKEFMPFASWEHQDAASTRVYLDYNKYRDGFQLKYETF